MAILVLDTLYKKYCDITIYHGFTKACGMTVLLECFDLFVTNLLASKEFLDMVKPR